MSHLRDGNILLPGPECFVKMLFYSNLSYKSLIKSLTAEATNSIPVLVVKSHHHAMISNYEHE